MSSRVAACSSVSSHLLNRLRTARNMAAASSCVIGSGRKAVTAVSTGCKASMTFLHIAPYISANAIWQHISEMLPSNSALCPLATDPNKRCATGSAGDADLYGLASHFLLNSQRLRPDWRQADYARTNFQASEHSPANA